MSAKSGSPRASTSRKARATDLREPAQNGVAISSGAGIEHFELEVGFDELFAVAVFLDAVDRVAHRGVQVETGLNGFDRERFESRRELLHFGGGEHGGRAVKIGRAS